MSYSRKVPQNRIEPLAWLGKTDWITPTANGYRRSDDTLHALLRQSRRFGRVFAGEVEQIINLSLVERTPDGPRPSRRTAYTDLFFMGSKILGSGQKTIQLSQEWCEAFENTELNLSWRDYRQPFPTMVVELPSSYAELKFVPGAGNYPEYVAVHHDAQRNLIVSEIGLPNSQISLILPFRHDITIEECLARMLLLSIDDVGLPTAGVESLLTPFYRIALNAMIAMTYGTDWSKLDLTQQQRQTRKTLKIRAGGKDRETAQMARIRLGIMPNFFAFHQTIKAFEESSPPQSPSTTSGSPKKPHWRHGHWRWQAVGKGRKERELIWIQPMLIRADRFGGDLKDTTTTYTT